MKKRKKTSLDGIDKEILRTLYFKRPLVSRKIASSVGRSAAAISSRLNHLKDCGLIKISKVSKLRVFERNFGNQIIVIKSPRYVYWDLDLES